MGIKGIYRELGQGQRISLARLAAEQLESSGRPLRLAIDIAIWQFQTQAAKGGNNPAIRTLFYRLVRLLSLSIQPVFVFDGPHKPGFKRNKKTSHGHGPATAMAKKLIQYFGFPVHQAPGEAEAECALLQRKGIVDAVLSEDVDTIMFGCTRTLRNWSADGLRSSKSPTHVTLYDVNEPSLTASGLDREGMVLVALMSGGDYLPEGLPGCGVKLACEAARAGFGRSLCRIKTADKPALTEWKMNLENELRTNSNGYFRTRHKALAMPVNFPDMAILRHYTHPAVSTGEALQQLRDPGVWNVPVDVESIRMFAARTFDWNSQQGAVKFVRVLSPSVLVHKLLSHTTYLQNSVVGETRDSPKDAPFIRGISSRRNHASTDGISEVRVNYVPSDIISVGLPREGVEMAPLGRQELAIDSDEEVEVISDGKPSTSASQRVSSVSMFNPESPQYIWVPEIIVKNGAPSTFLEWEERHNSKPPPQRKSKPKEGRKGQGKKNKTSKLEDCQQNRTLDAWLLGASDPGASENRDPDLNGLCESIQSMSITRTSLRDPSSDPTRLGSEMYHIPRRTKLSSKPLQMAFVERSHAANPTSRPDLWSLTSLQPVPRIAKITNPAEELLVSPNTLGPGSISNPLHVDETPQPQSSDSIAQCSISKPTLLESNRRKGGRLEPSQDNLSSKQLKIPVASKRFSSSSTRKDLSQTSITSFIPATNTRCHTDASCDGNTTLQQGGKVKRRPGGTGTTSDDDISKLFDGLALSFPSGGVGGSLRSAEISAKHPLSSASEDGAAHSGAADAKTAATSTESKTQVLITRSNIDGFFEEMEVSNDMARCSESRQSPRKEFGQKKPVQSTFWMKSSVSVIDLTGEDA